MFAFFQPLRKQPQIALLLVLIALILAGNGLVAPVLSLYALSFGVSSTFVGLIITVFGVARLMTNIPAGHLSLRVGLKPLLVAGPAVIVVGSIGAALTDDFIWLLIFRFIQGAGSGIYMTTSSAAAAGFASAGERGRVMALYQAALLFGAGIGPAIGGFAAEYFGLAAPFWAYAVVCAAAVVVALFIKPPEIAPLTEEEAAAAPSGPLLLQPLLLLVCFVNFGVFFTRTAATWQMIPLLGHEGYGMSLQLVGAALALSALVNFLLLPLTGSVIDRFGPRRVSCVATFFAAMSILTIGTGWGEASYWLGLVMLGVSSSFNGPAIASLAAQVIPRHLYGPGMGIFRTGGDIGFVLGPILVGIVIDWTGLVGGFMLNGFVVLAGAAVLTSVAYNRLAAPRQPPRPPPGT